MVDGIDKVAVHVVRFVAPGRGKKGAVPDRNDHRAYRRAKAAPANEAPPATAEPCQIELKQIAGEALHVYLEKCPRGGHLSGWLRDGKHRLEDIRMQACARGDTATASVALALLRCWPNNREEVRRSLKLPKTFGRVVPENAT